MLPVDRPVKLTLNSVDVIHSFWVPEFGQKSDAVPGIETTLVITPNRTGHFALMCTELCGLGHATMRAHVRVVTRRRYEKFLTDASGGAERETSGKAAFTTAGCGSCHTFTPAGSDAQVGPSLDTIKPPAGKPLEEFLHESILEPDAVVAAGFQPGVMPKTSARRSPTSSSTLSCSIWSTDRRGASDRGRPYPPAPSTLRRRRGAA